MLFAAVLGVIAGFVAGGGPANLGGRRIRGTGFAVMWIGAVLVTMRDWLPWAFEIYLASFICALIFVALNVRVLPALVVVGLGLALNLGVVVANDGMPFTAAAVRAAEIPRPADSTIVATPQRHLQTEADRLYPLIDHLPVAAGPIREVLSPGDVMIAVGLGLTCCTAMLPSRRRRPTGELVPIPRRAAPGPRPTPLGSGASPAQVRPTRSPVAPVRRQQSAPPHDPGLDDAGDLFWEERSRYLGSIRS
jgi:hypothetical protein